MPSSPRLPAPSSPRLTPSSAPAGPPQPAAAAALPKPTLHLEPFLKPHFNALDYTKDAILAGGLSLEGSLASLRASRETLDQAISATVGANEDALLGTLETVGQLKREMQSVHTDAAALDVSVGRVSRDVKEPLDRLKHSVRRLKNVHEASHVLRRLGWFLVASKRRAGGEGAPG